MPKTKKNDAPLNGDAILNVSLTMSLIKKLVEKGLFSNEDASLIIRDALHGLSQIEPPASFVYLTEVEFLRDAQAEMLYALPQENEEPI